MLRKTIPIAFLCVLSLLLGSCANVSTAGDNCFENVSEPAEVSGSEPIDPAELTVEDMIKSLKVQDYGGYEFVITTSLSGRFIDYENSENEVERAITERNKAVEKLYNIVIKEKTARESEIINTAKVCAATNIYFTDLLSASMPTLAKIAASGALTNLNSLAYYDSKASFCSQELREWLTMGHTFYAAFDDLTLSWRNATCVFFNKELADGELLYRAASDGEWDWELFLGYAADGGYASCYDSDETTNVVFATSGVTPLICGYDNTVTQNGDTQKLDEVALKVKEVLASPLYAKATGDDAVKLFIGGEVAFLIAPVGSIEKVSNGDIDFGVLTLPTFDGVTRSVLGSSSCGIAVPLYQKDSDRTGVILTALTAASNEHIKAAELKNHIYFRLRDNGSALMVGKIYDSLYLNAGMLYSGGFTAIDASAQDAILESVKNGKPFADIFAREKTQLETAVEKYFR